MGAESFEKVLGEAKEKHYCFNAKHDRTHFTFSRTFRSSFDACPLISAIKPQVN